MNRRKAVSLLTTSAFTFIIGSLSADNKKKNKNKNKNKNKKKNNKPANNKKKEDDNKPKKLSGKITLVQDKISLIYKLEGSKTYSFSKTLEEKIIPFKDQRVNISGVVDGDRIITVESIKAAKSS